MVPHKFGLEHLGKASGDSQDDLGRTGRVCRCCKVGGGGAREMLLYECHCLTGKLWLKEEEGGLEGNELGRKGE